MGSLPQSMNTVPSAFSGYPHKQPNADTQDPRTQSAVSIDHQSGFVPLPPTTLTPLASLGSYAPSQPVAAPPGPYSGDQLQFSKKRREGRQKVPRALSPTHISRSNSGSAPPLGAVQGLVEHMSLLSLGSFPGSSDSRHDSKALEGDVEQNSLAKMYPMNCNSRYLRTTSAVPNSQSLASKWHLFLGAVVCPLAEAPDGEELPIVNFGTIGIIRCRRCCTFVNPYVTFIDCGRKWQCNICALPNDVPGDYFAHLDASGQRVDLNERPELTNGSVEFIAPAEYFWRPPRPTRYFFLIDVSVSAVKSGMLEVVAQTIKYCLGRLPGYPRTQIGFITFDTTIHFYNMKSSLMQPQMMVVSDLDDIIVPLPDDYLVNLSESRSVVDAFLDNLPSMFQDTVNVESAFGPALKAAFRVMKQLGGKLLIFQNTLPSLGVGRLRLRGDDLHVYGTDKEHALRIPEDPFYKQMATDFTQYQISVNVYAFSDKYTDIASLGTLSKYSSGQIYYYPSFQSAVHKEKLMRELTRDLTRETAWEALLRIRCGKGVRVTSYHGNFMPRSTDTLALPAIDCDKAYAMQFCLEETILTTQTIYFQAALAYTSSSGERRIRVHTAAAPVVTHLREMYSLADTGAIVSLFSRIAIEKTVSSKLEAVRNWLQSTIIKATMDYYNVNYVPSRLEGTMICREPLKFMPLHGLITSLLCKSSSLRYGDDGVQLDESCAAGYTMMALPVKKLLNLLYSDLRNTFLDPEFNVGKRLPLFLTHYNVIGQSVLEGMFNNSWKHTSVDP